MRDGTPAARWLQLGLPTSDEPDIPNAAGCD